jgi:hypothetical protein
VRPSALAVFVLITNSNLVGCSTGRLQFQIFFQECFAGQAVLPNMPLAKPANRNAGRAPACLPLRHAL